MEPVSLPLVVTAMWAIRGIYIARGEHQTSHIFLLCLGDWVEESEECADARRSRSSSIGSIQAEATLKPVWIVLRASPKAYPTHKAIQRSQALCSVCVIRNRKCHTSHQVFNTRPNSNSFNMPMMLVAND